MTKRILIALALAYFALTFALPAHAQSYELACPAGSSPMPGGVTFNPVTNKLRAWLCVDDTNGTVTVQGVITGATTFNLVGAGTNANALHVGTGGALDHTGTGTINASSLTSNTTNPASAGLIRFSKTDSFDFRNNTNTANINGLSLDASNRVLPGGFPGISGTGSFLITPSLSGAFAAPTVTPNTPNATSYTYTIVANNGIVPCDISAQTTIANGPTTISGGDTVTVSWLANPCATSYDVFRFTTGTQGIPPNTDGRVATTTGLTINDTVTTPTGHRNPPYQALGGVGISTSLVLGDASNASPSRWFGGDDPTTNPVVQINSNSRGAPAIFLETDDDIGMQIISGGISGDPRGALLQGFNISSNHLVTVRGIIGLAGNLGTGISDEVFAGEFGIDNENTGVATIASAIRILSPLIITPAIPAGITELNAIRIEDQSIAGVASYGIHFLTVTLPDATHEAIKTEAGAIVDLGAGGINSFVVPIVNGVPITRQGTINFDLDNGGYNYFDGTTNWVITASSPQFVFNCGSTSTCAGVAATNSNLEFGSAPLVSGVPSTVTITGLNFTNSTSYKCTLSNETSAVRNLLQITYVDGGSFTVTGPATVTDQIGYVCQGK